MKLFAAALFAACGLCAVPVFAQPVPTPTMAPKPMAATPAPSASPTPSPSPTPREWVTTGFIDSSYSSAASSASFHFGDGTNSRVFDTSDKSVMLNAINLQLIHNGTLGGKIELTAGQDADVLASWPTANNNSFDITNAYVSYTAGAFQLQAGKFSTLAGAEVIESPSNLNFSRSILFGYAVPFTHTGLRLTYTATPTLSVIAGVNNGWDNTKGNGTGAKTIEGGLAYNNKNLSVTTQGYSGTEMTAYGYNDSVVNPVNGDLDNWSNVLGKRKLIDAVASYKFGPVITLSGNYDSGSQENAVINPVTGLPTVGATWNGAAGYVSAALTPKFTTTLRYESFDDPQGYRTSYAQRWSEGTLTLQYAATSAITFRLEGRADHSNVEPWVDGNGNPIGHLQSIAAEGIVKF